MAVTTAAAATKATAAGKFRKKAVGVVGIRTTRFIISEYNRPVLIDNYFNTNNLLQLPQQQQQQQQQ